ncbi:MAG TPA: hypothetical protein VGM29_15235 [Polyangiaceae bacterium]|jgi:hypothetical protein
MQATPRHSPSRSLNRTKSKSATSAKPATTTTANAPLLTPSIEHYQRFLPAARDVAADKIRIARVDVTLVRLNAARGVKAVLARSTDLAAVPGISLAAIRSLEDMGAALAYAAGHVERYMPIVGSTKLALAKAHALRAKLMAKADVLVLDGIVPAATVAGIRKGKGSIDTAGDCVALAALFHEYAASLPKSVVVDPADVQAADEIGRKLLVTLRPANAKREHEPALVAAADARDRLWTLFEQTWEQHVWRAGAYLFARNVETHVPLLQTGTRSKRTTKPEPEPEPVVSTPASPATTA